MCEDGAMESNTDFYQDSLIKCYPLSFYSSSQRIRTISFEIRRSLRHNYCFCEGFRRTILGPSLGSDPIRTLRNMCTR